MISVRVVLSAVLCVLCHLTLIQSSCPVVYPRQWVAYHLAPGEMIEIDGMLDDPAWTEIEFSQVFQDIQGSPPQPVPRFDTHMKMRWDDTFLYIAAKLVETQVWANMTQHDSVVFNDNDFEFFCDPDGSTHNYKEFEINAINTVWDLMLDKPYLDGGNANDSWDMLGQMMTATYVDGPLNNPAEGPDSYWSVELALPLKSYVEGCSVATAPPNDGDLWRINFSRVEYYVTDVNGVYEKVPNIPCDNWVWQSQGAIDMHLPERWGYLQFSTAPVNSTDIMQDPRWPQIAALAQVYYAEKEYMVVNGYYIDDLSLLALPDWVLDGSCSTSLPNITLPAWSFESSITSTNNSMLPIGHIRQDRLIWFTS